ncbi:ABC transporter substrate-binding protein [Blastococcus sp. SYSU DS0510]
MRTRSLSMPLLLLPTVFVTACGGGSTPTEPVSGTAAETRTVEHAAGTTDVPVDPEQIVTTTDQNALLPLLERGVTPAGSAGMVGEDGSTKFRRTEGFDTSGIAFTGAYGEPNLGAVTAVEPDLIVGYEFDEEFYDDLSRIAPTVLVQIFDRPLTEALVEFGELVGRADEARAMQAEYEARVADLRAQLGDRVDSLSVSVLGAGDPGTFGRGDSGQAVGTVMDDLGLPRTAAQLADDGEESYSLEQLSTRDADVVLVLDFTGDRQDPGLTAMMDSPTYQRLAAVQAGQAHVVDGTVTVGAAWARMNNFLDVLEQHLLPARDDVVVED